MAARSASCIAFAASHVHAMDQFVDLVLVREGSIRSGLGVEVNPPELLPRPLRELGVQHRVDDPIPFVQATLGPKTPAVLGGGERRAPWAGARRGQVRAPAARGARSRDPPEVGAGT